MLQSQTGWLEGHLQECLWLWLQDGTAVEPDLPLQSSGFHPVSACAALPRWGQHRLQWHQARRKMQPAHPISKCCCLPRSLLAGALREGCTAKDPHTLRLPVMLGQVPETK